MSLTKSMRKLGRNTASSPAPASPAGWLSGIAQGAQVVLGGFDALFVYCRTVLLKEVRQRHVKIFSKDHQRLLARRADSLFQSGDMRLREAQFFSHFRL